jgi:hypothetical protein
MNCPSCGQHRLIEQGVVHVGHYQNRGTEHSGLLWFCTDQCFLAFEHRKFMGAA